MKKIVPFSKVLNFDNNISEINSISLEHNFKNMGDEVAGEFVVSGDYIVDNETREKMPFSYKLPFDIALGVNYNKENMVLDIDDFHYEIISPSEVRVDIDLYIDGEVLSDIDNSNIVNDNARSEELPSLEIDNEVEIDNNNVNTNINDNVVINDNNMVLDNMNNIFDNVSENDGYSTYRVYTVMEGDTIDTILAKYNISIDELKKYNNIIEIKPMDKLIIPSNEK